MSARSRKICEHFVKYTDEIFNAAKNFMRLSPSGNENTIALKIKIFHKTGNENTFSSSFLKILCTQCDVNLFWDESSNWNDPLSGLQITNRWFFSLQKINNHLSEISKNVP